MKKVKKEKTISKFYEGLGTTYLTFNEEGYLTKVDIKPLITNVAIISLLHTKAWQQVRYIYENYVKE